LLFPKTFESQKMTSKLITAVSLSVLLVAGCNRNSNSTVRNSNKVRVGYIGLTCEAPIYAAYEKGFFKEEGLEAFANSYPHHLSGGMAQRVALARALINHPKVLLLDEPLGALDAFTRMRMQDEVLRLWENRRTTMLLVTHDIDEAIYMSDRIMIMTQRPGRIDQTIANTLARPRDRSSPGFLRLRGNILEHLHFSGNATTANGT